MSIDLTTLCIRPAELPDLDVCLTLDPTYSTEFVWQMDTHSNNGEISVAFRAVRLPRMMRVSYPRSARQLAWNWYGCEGFLVVELEGKVIAYAALAVRKDQGVVYITDIVVEQRYRQQGVGTALLRAVVAWGKERGMRQLIAELQTKNHPAICFYQKMGFGFCGFNDRYYANQDIAIFFVLGLR